MKCTILAILLLGASFGLMMPKTLAALTLDKALLILGNDVLHPSSDTNDVKVLMTPAPLNNGIVQPMFGAPPSIDIATISGNPQWFAFIDLEPCAFFEHDVLYVFIDDINGSVLSVPASDWPEIDGVEFGDGIGPGGKLIRICPLVSEPFSSTSTQSLSAATADYGDAPDGEVGGFFPTLYDTSNSIFSVNGGHAFPATFALGNSVSIETDASDPSDPDGVPNLNDADSDERMFIALDPNTATATGRLLFDAVSISNESAVLNLLADVNTDGRWGNTTSGPEWLLMNAPFSLSKGTNTYLSGTFSWAAGVDDLNGLWVRVALTDGLIAPAPYGTAGWDGSGNIGTGEIEDFVVQKCPSGGGGGGEPPEFEPEDTPPPGPKFGWNGLPVNYFSLVIQGPDHATQTAAREAGETMFKTLKAQGYNTRPIMNGANATAGRISEAIADIGSKMVCQDRILIYFVAHGKKNTAGGLMALAEAYTGADLDTALDDKIPPCANEECDEARKSCNVTVVIESCYSGQFMSTVPGIGREVFTASSATQPAHFGKDGSGGEYSDLFAAGADSNTSGVDANMDGETTPEEIHDYAAANLQQLQTPQKDNQHCDCQCPTNTWDCVYSVGGFGLAFPGEWRFNGSLLGTSFHGDVAGLSLYPDIGPYYDMVSPLELEPNEWLWDAAVFNNDFGQTNFFQVNVQGIEPGMDLVVPLPMWIQDPFFLPPQPFQLQINLSLDQFQITDGAGSPLMNGSWSEFPFQLEESTSPFARAGIQRANFLQSQPIKIQIETLQLQSVEPFSVLTWPAQENSLYDVYITEDLGSAPFVPLKTSLENNSTLIPITAPTAVFKIESNPIP